MKIKIETKIKIKIYFLKNFLRFVKILKINSIFFLSLIFLENADLFIENKRNRKRTLYGVDKSYVFNFFLYVPVHEYQYLQILQVFLESIFL